MRIPTSCMTCGMAALDAEQAPPTKWFLVDLNDDAVYAAECEKGHKIVAVLDALKYEVLFESGACALLCGFHREAVTSFGTALERFFEFCVRVFWEAGGTPVTVVDETWKHMRKQTERQIGAFLALYAARFKEAFPWQRLRMQQMTELRNEVVHHGRLPSQDDAKAYGRDVFNVVAETRARLLGVEDLKAAEDRVGLRLLFESHRVARERHGGASTQLIGMILSRRIHGRPDGFDERLAETARRVEWLVVPSDRLPRSS